MSLIEDIKFGEGYSDVPYTDDNGNLTIGYGTNIQKISKSEATMLLDSRVKNSVAEVDATLGMSSIMEMTEEQRNALYELCYWIGLPKFLGFKKMIKAVKASNYIKASEEMLDSRLARTYKTRANRLAYKLRGGL